MGFAPWMNGGDDMRIGVISDTHIPSRARSVPGEVFQGLMGVDLLIHAGDITHWSVIDELSAIAPVMAVYGNMDSAENRLRLPRTRVVEAEGVRIGVVHGDGYGGSTPTRALQSFSGVDCIVFGHSHKALCEYRGSILLFNPGSPTDRRTSSQFSYGVLHINQGKITGDIVYFGP